MLNEHIGLINKKPINLPLGSLVPTSGLSEAFEKYKTDKKVIDLDEDIIDVDNPETDVKQDEREAFHEFFKRLVNKRYFKDQARMKAQ